MTADEIVLPHATAQFVRGRRRVLHRQHSPSTELLSFAFDRHGKPIVEDPRRLDRQLSILMVVDERRRQRQNGSFYAVAFHSVELFRNFKERGVEPEMHAANVEIDQIAFAALDLDGELRPSAGETKKILGNEMAMNIGDHDHNPR